jgi:hypothetical protein
MRGRFFVWLASAAMAPALVGLSACETPAERQARENARIEKQAAAEINRICALPENEREAELRKMKEKSGMVLYCGNK